MTMNRTLMFLAGAVGTTLLWTAPVSAGPPPWTMDPVEGPVGAEVTIHGSCPDDINEWEAVSFYFETDDGTVLSFISHPVTAGESWDLPLVVPETEVGPHRIGKQCHRVDDAGAFDGGEATTRQPFEVTDDLGPDDRSVPEDEPTDEPSPVPDVAVAPAAPAVPVTRIPALTG
jgi:hypothetical protein